MKTKNKPYTVKELFQLINGRLKEKGVLPSFLDYGIASGKEDRQILTHFWDVTFKVRFGGSEGIYLDMYLSGDTDGTGVNGDHLFATYKTLERDDDIFLQMAILRNSLWKHTIGSAKDWMTSHGPGMILPSCWEARRNIG